MAEVHLTDRALTDLQDIYDYSVTTWDEIVADKYIEDIGAILKLLESNPKILKAKPQISKRFKTYQARRHYLIFEIVNEIIILLTIQHVSMNTLENIREIEPVLDQECNALYKKLKDRYKS